MHTIRRSRMKRVSSGKRLALTPRDLTIFKALAQYRYLRSTYLHAFAGGASKTRFKERLGDLFHEGFLDRPESQWQFAEARYRPVVYELGPRARHILAERGVPEEPRTFLGAGAHRQFAHAVTICECLASIELATIGRGDIRFIPWTEILARAPETTRAMPMPFRIPLPSHLGALIPDGLFGLEYRFGDRKTYRFFALEADRGTMPIARTRENETSYLTKLGAYRTVIEGGLHRNHWGIPNLLVLTITSGKRRCEEIVRQFTARSGGHAAFLFASGTDASFVRPSLQLLHEPWERAGHPPLVID